MIFLCSTYLGILLHITKFKKVGDIRTYLGIFWKALPKTTRKFKMGRVHEGGSEGEQIVLRDWEKISSFSNI